MSPAELTPAEQRANTIPCLCGGEPVDALRAELEAQTKRANENAGALFAAMKLVEKLALERDLARADLASALTESHIQDRARAIAIAERDTALAERDALIALADELAPRRAR